MPTKALIFDLGKVVFDVSFDRTFAYWSRASGTPVDEIRSTFRFDEIYEQFEIAAITPQQFRKAIGERNNFRLPDEQFDAGWCNLYLDVYPEVVELIQQLKADYRMVALTNTNEIHARVWPQKYADALSHFEKVFSSHELRLRKPDPEIFNVTLQWLNMQPGEVLFIDDNTDNIAAAEKMGIKTVLAVSPEQIVREVKEKLCAE